MYLTKDQIETVNKLAEMSVNETLSCECIRNEMNICEIPFCYLDVAIYELEYKLSNSKR